MSKQTAVEWLVDKLKSQGLLIGEPDNLVAVNKAKEMQKEQMENVWHDSRIEDFGDEYIGKQKSFNDYFNETFKQ